MAFSFADLEKEKREKEMSYRHLLPTMQVNYSSKLGGGVSASTQAQSTTVPQTANVKSTTDGVKLRNTPTLFNNNSTKGVFETMSDGIAAANTNGWSTRTQRNVPTVLPTKRQAGYYGSMAKAGIVGAVENINDAAMVNIGAVKNINAGLAAGNNSTALWHTLEANKNIDDEKTIAQALNTHKAQDIVAEATKKYNPTPSEQLAGEVVMSTTAMLPVVGASLINPVLGKGVLAAQAYGGGVQNAFDEGADLEKAKKYGAASAVMEVGSEALGEIPGMGGGVKKLLGTLNNRFGTEMTEKLVKLVGNKGVSFLLNAFEEGGEEVLVELLDPFAKRLTYDPNAETASFEDGVKAFALGAVTSGVLQGGESLAGRAVNTTARLLPTADSRQAKSVDYSPEVGTTEVQPIKAGKVTVIQTPYFGDTPQQDNQRQRQTVDIDQNSLDFALSNIAEAERVAFGEASNPKKWLKKVYEQFFESYIGGHGVVVESTSFQGEPYTVTLHKNLVGKIVSDPNLSAEKLAVFNKIDDVIKNAEFVGSGAYIPHNNKVKQTIRFDYFETETTIGGKPFVVAFDVEVLPWENKYRTHKVINKMNLIPLSDSDTGLPAALKRVSSPFIDTNIARMQVGVNNQSMQKKAQNSLDISSEELLRGAIEKYGAIPKGEQPRAREIELPKRTQHGKTARFARTAAESGAVADEQARNIQNEVLNGTFAYLPINDKSAVAQANSKLGEYGYEQTVSDWRALMRSDKRMGKNDIALGERLIQEAAKRGDSETVTELVADVAAIGTEAGQTIQAMRLLKRLSPEGQLMFIGKAINRMNVNRKQNTGKYYIPKECAADILAQTTPDGLEKAVTRTWATIAEQVPATYWDKWNAWRYLAMLGNARTHIRNAVSNLFFGFERKLKDVTAAGLEVFFAPLNGMERQKALLNPFNENDKRLLEFAKRDFANVKDQAMGGGKHNPTDIIRDNQRVFKTELLEKARKANTNLLEFEDSLFLKSVYADTLAMEMKARGLTAESLQDPQRRNLFEEMRERAIKAAQKATFRDANDIATAINRLARTNAATEFFIGGTIPFTKTPLNILRRGVEYSPAGLLKSISYDLWKVKNNEITASEAVDNIAAGLTGTGIMLLGALLAKRDLLAGGADEDKREDTMNKLTGEQYYALKLEDVSYTLDWMAPATMPLFVGAELYDSMCKKGGMDFAQFCNAMTRITEPMFEMSMLQGINSTIKSAAYGENAVGDIIVNTVANYVSQANPTLLGQIARTVDGTPRNAYYVDKNSPLPQIAQTTLNKNIAKLPLASMTLPARVDRWGRTEVKPLPIRAAENFVSPGYTSVDNTTPLDTEISRLYKATGEGAVVPSAPEKKITFDGETKYLTAKEYEQFAKTQGQTAYQMASKVISLPIYNRLSDESKAKILEDVYSYSKYTARKELLPQYSKNGWETKAEQAQKQGIDPVNYLLYRTTSDIDGNGSVTQEEAKKAILMLPIYDRKQQAALWQLQNESWKEKNNPFK